MTSKEKVIHNRASTKKEDARVTRSKRDLALALQDLLRTKTSMISPLKKLVRQQWFRS